MKTILIMAIGLGTALMWLAQQRRNQHSRSATKKLVLLAAKGALNFDVISETFDTLIKKINYIEDISLEHLRKENFLKNGVTIDKEKYLLQPIHQNGNQFLLIGEAKTKDLLPTHNGNKDIDKYYAANLLITFNQPEKEIVFHSAFPNDNEHFYLLENLAAAIYESLIK